MIKLYYTFSNPKSETFARRAISAFCSKSAFAIKRTENGKPYTDAGVHFSLSHTDGLTICAVSYKNVGADAEKLRTVKNKEKILRRYVGEETESISDEEFLRKWTRFESRVKFFGEKITSCSKAKADNKYTKTFNIGGYVVSIHSDEDNKIIKERLPMAIFNRADIMLPKNTDLTKWSVVACDQYTSQPEYWEKVQELVGDCPSTLNLVYPEAFLSQGDGRIDSINKTMESYCKQGIFNTYENCLIYTERTLSGGRVRKGIVGAVDLEEYDFNKGAKSAIRATEGTVLERIPPRVKIRENAPLELPHVMLLIDDSEKSLIENVKKGEKVYDCELMADGGHLCGWLVENCDEFMAQLDVFSEKAADGLVFAVGDGNHSLATAKTCWENLKPTLSDAEKETHPARFCLVEIENIHDDVLEFEPIHRVVFGIEDEDAFINRLTEKLGCSEENNGGQEIVLVKGENMKTLYMNNTSSPLAVGTLQKYLDTLSFEVDYIHGADVVKSLSAKAGAVGLLLPKPEKSSLFETVIKDGALPRKTFSMGEANEKRFYMEAKAIR